MAVFPLPCVSLCGIVISAMYERGDIDDLDMSNSDWHVEEEVVRVAVFLFLYVLCVAIVPFVMAQYAYVRLYTYSITCIHTYIHTHMQQSCAAYSQTNGEPVGGGRT